MKKLKGKCQVFGIKSCAKVMTENSLLGVGKKITFGRGNNKMLIFIGNFDYFKPIFGS
jgi:hypothetical protein